MNYQRTVLVLATATAMLLGGSAMAAPNWVETDTIGHHNSINLFQYQANGPSGTGNKAIIGQYGNGNDVKATQGVNNHLKIGQYGLGTRGNHNTIKVWQVGNMRLEKNWAELYQFGGDGNSIVLIQLFGGDYASIKQRGSYNSTMVHQFAGQL